MRTMEKLRRKPDSTISGVMRLGITCRRITVRGGTPHAATALTKSRSDTSCAAACRTRATCGACVSPTTRGRVLAWGLRADHAQQQEHEDKLRDSEQNVDRSHDDAVDGSAPVGGDNAPHRAGQYRKRGRCNREQHETATTV